ncbi:hypothetical protein GCM10009610_07740 [Pseudonocardia xinjiangensis]
MEEPRPSATGEPAPPTPPSGSVAVTAGGSDNAADRLVLSICRALSAALLLVVGGSHLVLYFVGYGSIPTIGVSFLLNAVGGTLLALAVVVVRPRYLRLVTVLGALFMAATLGALALALTVGLFGFVDELTTPLVPTTLVLELAGVVVLTVTAVIANRIRRSR